MILWINRLVLSEKRYEMKFVYLISTMYLSNIYAKNVHEINHSFFIETLTE